MKKKLLNKLIFTLCIAFTFKVEACQNLLAQYKPHFEWSYTLGSLVITPFLQEIFGDYSGNPILKKLADSGLIFCPVKEQECFIKYLDDNLVKQGYEKIIETFAECNPLREAFNNSLGYLKDNAGSVINNAVNDYFIGSGSCMKALNEYLSYSRSQCPGSIGDQCSNFVRGHDCVSIAKAGRKVISIYNQTVGGVTQAVNTFVGGVTQTANTIASGTTQAYNKAAPVVTQAANTIASGTVQASNTIASGATQVANTLSSPSTWREVGNAFSKLKFW